MRINQYIARSGVASRRKAEELIRSGKVLVNGKVTMELSSEISPEDKVTVSGRRVSPKSHQYYLFNKPAGYTCSKSDPFALHTIFELLPKDNSLFPVGRLDRDTTGLLLITNDGDFAQNIIHPSKKIEKEYYAKLLNPITTDELRILERGVELEDGFAQTKTARVLSDKEITMVIEMGKKRIIKRMILALGNKVTGLKRERIGKIKLDVPIGQYRKLTEKEVAYYA